MKFLTPKRFTLKLRNKFCISLLAAFVWTLVLGETAKGVSLKYTLNANTNGMSASSGSNLNNIVRLNAQWYPSPTNTWFYSGHLIDPINTGDYTVVFSRLPDFYKPDLIGIYVSGASDLTCYYYTYSNSLSVVVSGMVGGATASWRLTSWPANEYTNSSTYTTYGTNFTDSIALSNIPDGSYTITFNPTNGYTTPPAITTNISAALTNIVTGTYARVFGTITVTVSTNGSWSFTAPSDFTNYNSSALSGTNNATLTNMPVGVYTIHYNDLGSPYVTPADQTKTNTTSSTNLSFVGTYLTSTQSWLTVFFNPLAVRDTAQWKPNVLGSTWYDHLDSVLLNNGSDYLIYYSAVKDYYLPSTYTLSNMFGDVTITNTYIPYTNSLWVIITGLVDGASAKWSITSPLEFTNSSAYQTTYTNSKFLSPIPTGSYTIAFSNLTGYTKPDNITTNITGAFNPTVTGAYVYLSTGTNDSDGDGLPDGWEIKYGLNPYDATGTNGADGNVDNDWIPSASTNTPILISIDSNNIVRVTFSGNGDPSYPLQRGQLLSHLSDGLELPEDGSELGYSKGVPFINLLECRGLDGYYLTNGPNGTWVPNDDPLTSPTWFDTFSTEDHDKGISDGWKYYFWYWRSKEAYDAGITNSANLSWVTWSRTKAIVPTSDTDGDGLTDGKEYNNNWTDPTHCDTDGDSMDDYWEINNITPGAIANSNALDYVNNWRNPDGDYMASVTNTVLTNGTIGTALGTNVCWSGGIAANPNAAWNEISTNSGANVFDLYQDTILKASSGLTNHASGTRYAFTNYFGTNSGLTYKDGYPVWVDVDNSGTYSAGDYALVNPTIKHDGVYLIDPQSIGLALYPGVCSFNPYTAWTNIAAVSNGVISAAPDTIPYTTYQEYLGGDYIGRLSWNAGGQMSSINDNQFALNRNSYSNPNIDDTDIDQIPDGWELYTGLDPNNVADAGAENDGDHLNNLGEWANTTHRLGNCASNWPNKTLPTDPGVIVAPAPNDPHPMDTDWDGLRDGFNDATTPVGEQTMGSNPSAWDTDGDHLPDGWEVYARSSVTNADAQADNDGDGLRNYQEYWCGTVPEWMFCDQRWQGAHIDFCVRRAMTWDPFVLPAWTRAQAVFIPPDYLTDPCFMVENGLTNVAQARINYPANLTWEYQTYHTPLAFSPDSDQDNMDDYWEVYHGLNPCMGFVNLMLADNNNFMFSVADPDADPVTPGYQFGRLWNPFASLAAYIAFIEPNRYNAANRINALLQIVGPFNFGRYGMDPDGDGLANLEEYSYNINKPFYHTDPTPIWRTDQTDTNSFINFNYSNRDHNNARYYWWDDWNDFAIYPFEFECVEGYDTDEDGVGDYAEINSAAGQLGNNPLDERNPIRNRALYFNGTTDFALQFDSRAVFAERNLTRFCVEAWIKPDNPSATNQVVLEKAGLYQDPYTPAAWIVCANFRMGITNGLPYVLYHGRTSLRAYQATAQTRHRITSNTNWTHIAGAYDATNLTIYVNGEESYSLRTTELPVNGYDLTLTNGTFLATSHTLIIGARDNHAGAAPRAPLNYFGGCIDEVRVWDGVHTRAEILANKNRRLTQTDITNTMQTIYNYFTFDDVPDPNRSGESNFPAGMDSINPDMHPAIIWWSTNALRSTVYTGVTNSYNYVVFAADHGWHSRAIRPVNNQLYYSGDDYYHFSTNFAGTNSAGTNILSGYINPANPYHQNLYNANNIYDLLLYRGARAVATNSWLSGLSSDPDSTDTDGDGLPDWWEQLYNLDPNDATGDNGAWGDVDNDGLNNRAEYLAGTSPRNSDTDGDGIGDYDSRSGPYTRTYGEMYMDGDGMPDVWEMQYGLDPYHYDANLDLDNDGWSNYAEYQAGTNPNDASSYPQPAVSGSADYFGNNKGTFRFYVYATNTMDGEPLITQVGAGQQVAETIGPADGTLYFSGRLPIYPIDQTTVVRISAPAGTNSTTVTFTFTSPTAYTYSGVGTDYDAKLNYTTGKITIRWASTEVPAVGANVSVDYTYANRNSAAFSLTGFREGDFYLLALLDNGNNTFDAGEPMGIMEGQPLTLGHTSLGGVRIHVKDTAPGYGRFAWTGNTTGTSDYPVVINKISEQNAPTVLTRSMRWSRNYMHEWDYQIAGLYGLSAGTYQWWMNSQQGTFSVSWPASVTTPSLVYPRGDQFNYAVNQFKWTMDSYSTMYHLQVSRQAADRSLAVVLDQYYPVPYCDANGTYQADLPKYAGELGDGVYYWRVASWSPAGESAWPEAQTFNINLSATNSHWIAGDIYYFGKADCSNIVVEAFDNSGFSGKPDARMLLTGAVRSNSFKGSFTLRGLPEGNYYVRAYLDVTPAGGTRSGKLDKPWESFGFIRDPNNDYKPRTITLLNTMFVDGTKLVIRDQDTDNDLLPDAWEMYYFGDLNQTGDMDYDGDGETNLEEYMRDGVDMNPASWDTDGDGLSDAFEINYTAPSFGYSAKSGQQLNPMLWDTDGDRYSDGAEMKRYHTDPLDPTSYPRYQPMCFDASRSPGDYDGDGRTDLGVYDVASGNWYLMTAAGGFYNLPFGSSATLPMLGDYTGDGCDDFAVFEPATGAWHLYNAWTGQSFSTRFGDSEMIPVPADYDGDNKTDLAVYYPAEGMWYIYSVWSGQFFSLQFGGPTCVPVPGDYNSDGAGDLATYEPNTGNWNIFTFDHYRLEGKYFSGNFGGPTMMPAEGDYDGDGRNDAALFEATTGNWYILTWRGQFVSGQFGWYGCIPAPGDYDGDGRTDVCVYYPPTGTWYIYCWSGQAYQVQFGFPSAVPALKGR